MPWVPRRRFWSWPENGVDLSPPVVRQLYEAGFAGAIRSPEAWGRFHDTFGDAFGDPIAHEGRFAGGGAGSLVFPWVFVGSAFPGCWPGEQGQGRGDCVSWSTRNALLLTMAADIAYGEPDEATGQKEVIPAVPAEGVADGVLSTEAIYWYRGYDGDGWFCPEAARVACNQGGCVLRQRYTAGSLDLTRYNSRTAGRWGKSPPPSDVVALTGLHPAHRAAELTSLEQVRDFLAQGFGVSGCGSEGWSDKRDANGVSERSGSWAHAMAIIGWDARPSTVQLYGGELGLQLNSWGRWNSGPREVRDSAGAVPPSLKARWVECGLVSAATGNLLIPEGSNWCRARDLARREFLAFSGVRGWDRASGSAVRAARRAA